MIGWRQDARCTDFDPEVFFPVEISVRGKAPSAAVIEAKIVCASCPVRLPCLDAGMRLIGTGSSQSQRVNFPVGIWGGTTTKERLRLRRVPRDQRRAFVDELLASQLSSLVISTAARRRASA